MKKMYKILGLCVGLSAISTGASAQWKGVVANLGYTFGNTKVEAAGYNGSSTLEQTRKHNVVTFGMMAAGGHAFFDMNFGLPVVKKDKIGNVFNTKFAVGGYAGKSLGFMVGGHYNFISYGKPVVASPYQSSFPGAKNGWNQRGVGMHVLLNPGGEEDGHLLVRLSLMKDWLRRESKKYKGDGFTPEMALYYTFDDDRSFGLQMTATYSALKWNSFKDEANNNAVVPENKMNAFTINLGLIFPLSMCSSQSRSYSIITVTPK